MSLINEALKKAQRQRSLDSAPLSSAPSGVAAAAVTTHVRAASHKRSHAALGFGLGLVALGAVATVLVMCYGFDSAEPAKPVAVAPTTHAPGTVPASQVSSPPAIAPAPTPAPATLVAPVAPMVVLPPIPQTTPSAPVAHSPSPAPAPAPAHSVSVGVAAMPAPAPTAVTPPTALVPVPAPVTSTVAPAATPTPVVAVAAPLTPAEREAGIYAFLNSLRLTGVRGVEREARVLMNERVWRLNDVVSPELGLRLSAVRPNLLVFTDTQGRTYEKPY